MPTVMLRRRFFAFMVAMSCLGHGASAISLTGVPADLELSCGDAVPAPALVTASSSCYVGITTNPPQFIRAFSLPYEAMGVAVATNGLIYTSSDLNTVRVYSPTGGFLFAWGSYGSVTGKFNRPAQLSFSAAGLLHVADRDNNRVQVFRDDGSFAFSFGGYGSVTGKFNFVDGVGVDRKNGRILVADRSNHRVQIFDLSGNFLFTFGSYGSGNGQLDAPGSVEADANGNILVGDLNGNRIQMFSPQGAYIKTIATGGSAVGQVGFPRDMAIDAKGRIYVTDNENHRIQVWDSEGNHLAVFGQPGSGAGSLSYPQGIAVDVNGLIYVADTSDRIMIYEWPSATVTSQGLAVHYTFDEDGGASVSDVSGNQRNAVVSGAVWSATGKVGGSMMFDGVNDVVTGKQNPYPTTGTSNLTVSAWIKLDAFRNTTAWNANPIAVQWHAFNNAAWIFTVNKNRKLGFAWNQAPFTDGSATLQTGVWYHVAVTYDGNHVKLYLNGALDRSFATNFSFKANGYLEVGACPYDRAWLKGNVDDFRMYQRTLSAAEIAALNQNNPATVPVVLVESGNEDPDVCPRTITRVWTATDGCGASVSATQTIAVAASQDCGDITLVGVPADVQLDCGVAVPPPASVTAYSTGAGQGSVSSDGLVLHYRFDDAGNLGLDSSSEGQQGTVAGVTYAPAGKLGGAGSFAGLGERITVEQLQKVQGSYQLSWGAWVKPESGPGLYGVMGKTRAGNESFYLHVKPSEAHSQAYIVPQSRAEERYARNFGVIQAGAWQHVMGTYDGHEVRLYLNGQLVHSNYYADYQPVRSNNVTFAVGTVGVGLDWIFKGLMDDVRIYNRTLSAAEVASLAQVGQSLDVQFAETVVGDCPGVITRVWTATDGCGASVSATQTITVAASQECGDITLVGVPADLQLNCGDTVPPAASVTAYSSSAGQGSAPSDGLLLYYSFDEASDARVIDESGMQRTGTVHGATWVADGVRGGAYRFDDVTNYISATDAGLPDGDSPRSVSWWFTVPAIHDDGGSDMFSYGTQSYENYFYFGVDWRNGRKQLAFSPWGWVFLANTKVEQADTWYHAVFTYGGNGAKKFYINGVEQSGYSEGGDFNTVLSGTLRIGPHVFSAHPFAGKIDELRIYNRAVSADEVSALYQVSGTEPLEVAFSEDVSGSCPQTISRVWTATDACGNSASATQTITVLATEPTEPPVLVGVPGDITVDCDSIPAPAIVTALSGCQAGVGVPAEGLILHYTFDNAQNLGQDSSGLDQHGVVSGVSHANDGVQGGAGLFTGEQLSAIVVNQLKGVSGSTQLTWGAWVKSTSSSLQGVMGKTVAGNESFYLHVRPGQELAQAYVMPTSRAEERYARNFGTVHAGSWHHVMATYDGNTVSLYIDGQFVHSNYYANAQPIRSNNVAFTVGDVGDGMGWAFAGLIDDVRIYQRALVASEVAAVAASGGAVDVAFTESSSSDVCPKVITRVWTATDACGNTASATQSITVLAADIDSDGDGLLDSEEKRLGTNPKNPDTDGDGRSDGVEVDLGTDPLVFDQFPYCVRNDFDGDKRSDVGVYDHVSGTWHLMRSSAGYTNLQYGYYGTTPVPGDYDGDAKADLAIYDPKNSTWHIFGSKGKPSVVQWGFRGTVPVPADYDGDGRTDIAVYHGRLGFYLVNGSKRGTFFKRVSLPGGQPVVGDFDGDKSVDFGVFQPSSAKWKIQLQGGGVKNFTFGDIKAKGLAADYDGDGRADPATFNTENGTWMISGSKRGAFKVSMPAGAGGLPITGDYTGNNIAETVVYLPLTGEWLYWGSNGQIIRYEFGSPTATPLGAGP